MFKGPDISLACTLKNSFPDEVLPVGETLGLEMRILWSASSETQFTLSKRKAFSSFAKGF